MKLIGSLTSSYVRKIRVLLLEKGMPFELVVDSPWEPSTHISDFNPLGKVPALVTDEGETLFDSNIIAEHIELTGSGPRFLPTDRTASLRVRQLVMLADGITDAGVAIFLERKRSENTQNADWISRQQGKILRGLDTLEQRAAASAGLAGVDLNLADIATGCTLFWLGLRVADLAWQTERPTLVALADRLAARPSFQQTIPPA